MAYPGNTARAVFEFSLANGSLGYVTPHVRKSDGGDYTLLELQGLGDQLRLWATDDDFQGNVNNSLLENITDDVTLNSITLTTLSPTTPLQHVEVVAQQGMVTGLPLPNETAVVVTLYTGTVGRSYRGRNFWPGASATFMEANGTMNEGVRANWQLTFEALIDGLATGTSSELAVNSETLGLSTFVTSCIVRDVFHHQRRRNS